MVQPAAAAGDGQGDELGDGQAGELVRVNGGTLRPFRKGDGRAAAAGRKGGQTTQRKRAAEHAPGLMVLGDLRTLVAGFDRGELGPIAAAAAADMIGRVHRGEQVVRDPAEWVRVLVDVARLEAGEPTSASVVAHLGASAVHELRDRARAALGAGDGAAALAGDAGAADQG